MSGGTGSEAGPYGYQNRLDANNRVVDDPSVRTPPSQIPLITSANIAAEAITTRLLQAEAVTAEKILAGTIVAANIAAGTITANEIAAGTIVAANIAAGTITANEIDVSTLNAIDIDAFNITSVTFAAGLAVIVDGGGGGTVAAIQNAQYRLEESDGTLIGYLTTDGDDVFLETFPVGADILIRADTVRIQDSALDSLAFFGAAGQAKPTVTGSRQTNPAIADLLSKLAGFGLITDSTTAGSVPAATSFNGGTFVFQGVGDSVEFDAVGDAAATEQAWLEVSTDAGTGYIRIFASP